MRGSIQIGRVFGIPLFINITWAPVFLLLVTFFATRGLPGSVALRGQPAWFSWALALSVGLVFAASLVAHELGHSVVARFFNVPVRGITLFVLGAVAQTSRESRRASHEFLMAAAGPAVSILLGGVFMVGWFITGMGRSVVSLACELLWGMNVLVGLFNLLPAYPMDGGRILRSAIWAVTGTCDERRITPPGSGAVLPSA
ncbi:MAG: site-2 protease family protein [Dehalococcoidia bacterium]